MIEFNYLFIFNLALVKFTNFGLQVINPGSHKHLFSLFNNLQMILLLFGLSDIKKKHNLMSFSVRFTVQSPKIFNEDSQIMHLSACNDQILDLNYCFIMKIADD